MVGLVIMLWALGGLRTVTAPAAIGGPFQLTDQAGQTVTEKNLKGKPTLIFFGFTHCPDVCPTSLFEISEVLKAMGKDADRVNAYFVSVDPERDTAAAMKDYLSSFDPHLKGLTGDPAGGGQGDFGLPGLCQEGPAQGRRLHHGPHRADLSDGSRRQIRRAVQPETDARGSRGGSEAVSLSGNRPPKAENGPRIAGRMVYKAVKFRKQLPKMPYPDCPVNQCKTASNRPRLAGRVVDRVCAGWRLRGGAAQAQTQPRPAVEAAPQAVPGFWDPRRRPDRPDLSRLTVIRFLTETDYPPFNFTGPDGNPAGFNVDLARALCDEIKVTCTIQMRRFETLVDAITSNRGDAIIASLAVTPQLRARVDFTDPYYRAPARFVSRRDAVMPEVRPEYLEGKKVGVIAGTSHEAYLKAMFTDAEMQVLSQ